MTRLVSLIDGRHTDSFATRRVAAKAWWHHVALYGPGSCHLEADGVELDPVVDCGMTAESVDRALASFAERQEKACTQQNGS